MSKQRRFLIHFLIICAAFQLIGGVWNPAVGQGPENQIDDGVLVARFQSHYLPSLIASKTFWNPPTFSANDPSPVSIVPDDAIQFDQSWQLMEVSMKIAALERLQSRGFYISPARLRKYIEEQKAIYASLNRAQTLDLLTISGHLNEEIKVKKAEKESMLKLVNVIGTKALRSAVAKKGPDGSGEGAIRIAHNWQKMALDSRFDDAVGALQVAEFVEKEALEFYKEEFSSSARRIYRGAILDKSNLIVNIRQINKKRMAIDASLRTLDYIDKRLQLIDNLQKTPTQHLQEYVEAKLLAYIKDNYADVNHGNVQWTIGKTKAIFSEISNAASLVGQLDADRNLQDYPDTLSAAKKFAVLSAAYNSTLGIVRDLKITQPLGPMFDVLEFYGQAIALVPTIAQKISALAAKRNQDVADQSAGSRWAKLYGDLKAPVLWRTELLKRFRAPVVTDASVREGYAENYYLLVSETIDRRGYVELNNEQYNRLANVLADERLLNGPRESGVSDVLDTLLQQKHLPAIRDAAQKTPFTGDQFYQIALGIPIKIHDKQWPTSDFVFRADLVVNELGQEFTVRSALSNYDSANRKKLDAFQQLLARYAAVFPPQRIVKLFNFYVNGGAGKLESYLEKTVQARLENKLGVPQVGVPVVSIPPTEHPIPGTNHFVEATIIVSGLAPGRTVAGQIHWTLPKWAAATAKQEIQLENGLQTINTKIDVPKDLKEADFNIEVKIEVNPGLPHLDTIEAIGNAKFTAFIPSKAKDPNGKEPNQKQPDENDPKGDDRSADKNDTSKNDRDNSNDKVLKPVPDPTGPLRESVSKALLMVRQAQLLNKAIQENSQNAPEIFAEAQRLTKILEDQQKALETRIKSMIPRLQQIPRLVQQIRDAALLAIKAKKGTEDAATAACRHARLANLSDKKSDTQHHALESEKQRRIAEQSFLTARQEASKTKTLKTQLEKIRSDYLNLESNISTFGFLAPEIMALLKQAEQPLRENESMLAELRGLASQAIALKQAASGLLLIGEAMLYPFEDRPESKAFNAQLISLHTQVVSATNSIGIPSTTGHLGQANNQVLQDLKSIPQMRTLRKSLASLVKLTSLPDFSRFQNDFLNALAASDVADAWQERAAVSLVQAVDCAGSVKGPRATPPSQPIPDITGLTKGVRKAPPKKPSNDDIANLVKGIKKVPTGKPDNSDIAGLAKGIRRVPPISNRNPNPGTKSDRTGNNDMKTDNRGRGGQVNPDPRREPVTDLSKPVFAIFAVYGHPPTPRFPQNAADAREFERQMDQWKKKNTNPRTYEPSPTAMGYLAFRVDAKALAEFQVHEKKRQLGQTDQHYKWFRPNAYYHQEVTLTLPNGIRIQTPMFMRFQKIENKVPQVVSNSNVGLNPQFGTKSEVQRFSDLSARGSWSSSIGGRRVTFGPLQFDGDSNWSLGSRTKGVEFIQTLYKILGG